MFRISKRFISAIQRLSGVALFSLVLPWQPASVIAQQLGIVATVNDEMISMYDLNTRLDVVVAFSGFPNSPEVRRRIAPQVLRGLIDDRLKIQEAKRQELTISEGQLAAEKKSLERQNGMKPGGLKSFIASRGLQESTIDEQMEARALWARMINRRYSRGIAISEEEIAETIQRLEANKGKPEDLVYEIFLPVFSDNQEQEVVRLAERLVEQIRKGGNFSAIAQNFSQSASASSGGRLNWTLRGQHDPELNQIIATLQPGQISAPIRTRDGVMIVHLRQSRLSPGLDGGPKEPEKVKLFQLHFALPSGASAVQVSETMTRATRQAARVNNCSDMGQLAAQVGSPKSGELGTFAIPQISTQMRGLIQGLQAGQVSQPFQLPDGVMVLMVCDRIVPEVKTMTLAQKQRVIRNNILNERLTLAAKRFLRDLRRESFIDVRLGR